MEKRDWITVNCGRGHIWVQDAALKIECPECRDNEMKRAEELLVLKQAIKEAVLEALRERQDLANELVKLAEEALTHQGKKQP